MLSASRTRKHTTEKAESQATPSRLDAKEQETRIAEALKIVKQFPTTNDMFPHRTRTMWQACR